MDDTSHQYLPRSRRKVGIVLFWICAVIGDIQLTKSTLHRIRQPHRLELLHVLYNILVR